MKVGLKNVFITCLLVSALACRKEIHIDLNASDPRLVIEANYIASDSLVTVVLSQTKNYFDEYIHQSINSATVEIWEENMPAVTVPYVADGRYELSEFAPNYEKTYTVKVRYNGTEYQASSYLLTPMTLLEPKLEYSETSFITDFDPNDSSSIIMGDYWIYYRFKDTPGISTSYKLVYTHRQKRYDALYDFSIGTDKFTDGNIIERPILRLFPQEDTVWLELHTITPQMYDYYSQLPTAASAFDAAVGNPNYLWTNQALGYFSAYGYSKQEVVLPKHEG